jgi:hypothetical protein
MLKSFALLGIIFFAFTAKSQINGDTLTNSPDVNAATADGYTHYTKRAAIWSAVIPGAGQIYNEIGYRKIPQKKNRAWWKVPIIYGGLGACGYYYYQNNKFAYLTKKEFLFREENNGEILDQRFADYPFSATDTTYRVLSLINGYDDADGFEIPGFDKFANRRDLFMFGFIGVWALNVIEAYVDAHFVTFDVSEDLSMSIYPTIFANRSPGLSLKFDFN